MEPFKIYTFGEVINNETFLTRIQPQWYYKLIENLQRVGSLISNSKARTEEGTKAERSNLWASSGGQIFTEVCDASFRRGSEIGR